MCKLATVLPLSAMNEQPVEFCRKGDIAEIMSADKRIDLSIENGMDVQNGTKLGYINYKSLVYDMYKH